MFTQANGSWLSGASCVGVSLIALASTHARSAGWRDLQIDGSSLSSFEASVAMLQNELPQQRREDFEIALAAIWTRNTIGSGDLDHDGDVDLDDGQDLKDRTGDLLIDIRRGDIVAAISKGEANEGEYAASDYLEQLHGLGYDEVLSLAGPPSDDPYLADLRRPRPQSTGERYSDSCAREAGGRAAARSQSCAPSGATISASTGKALNTAIEALNAQKHDEARIILEELSLDSGLTPYERSSVELILFSMSHDEGKYAEAREHAQNAIAAGGLSEQGISELLGQIRQIDARLSASPP